MWPFKRSGIRRLTISIDYIEYEEYNIPSERYTIYLDENDYPEHFDEVWEIINDVVSKVKRWSLKEVEDKERVEFERLQKKFGCK